MANCDDEEQLMVRAIEDQAIQAEFETLTDLVLNCQNKFQFAKTYKVLRADLRKTFANSNLGNPKMPDHINRAVRQAFVKIGDNKLRYLAEWFYIKWADASDQKKVSESLNKGTYNPEAAIEQYAGKDDGSGCLSLVVFFGAAILGGPLAYFFLEW